VPAASAALPSGNAHRHLRAGDTPPFNTHARTRTRTRTRTCTRTLASNRFPDFSLLSPGHDDYTRVIDALFISHFHLDHVGALPFFTEVCRAELSGWIRPADEGDTTVCGQLHRQLLLRAHAAHTDTHTPCLHLVLLPRPTHTHTQPNACRSAATEGPCA
jgi:hypothetical protein